MSSSNKEEFKIKLVEYEHCIQYFSNFITINKIDNSSFSKVLNHCELYRPKLNKT